MSALQHRSMMTVSAMTFSILAVPAWGRAPEALAGRTLGQCVSTPRAGDIVLAASNAGRAVKANATTSSVRDRLVPAGGHRSRSAGATTG